MSELDNILPPNPDKGKGMLPEQQLMAYLEGRLDAVEQHRVEEWLAREGMEGDALEGLRDIPAAEARNAVAHMNHQLQKDLHKKKKKRRGILDNKWSLLAVMVIILLVVLGYIVIRLQVK